MSHANAQRSDGSSVRTRHAGMNERVPADTAIWERERAGDPRMQARHALSAVGTLADLLDEAVALVQPASGFWKANPALVRLLECSGAADVIEARLGAIASALPALRLRARRNRALHVDRFECAGATYEIRGCWIALHVGATDRLGVLRVRRARSTGIDAAARHFGLTDQQLRVARLLSRGLSNAELAGELFLSPHTVRHHVEQILQKLGVRSRVRAVALLGQHLSDATTEPATAD
jgi:DNA-binding CsgD family transcriptional regulator